MLSSFFSCFKSDPSKDHVKNAMEISRHGDEDRIVRQKREDDSKRELDKAIQESLKPAKDEKKISQESKENHKIKQANDNQQTIKHSKDLAHSICNGCKYEIRDEIPLYAFRVLWHPQCLCCLHCDNPIDVQEISNSRGQFHKPCYKEHNRPNCYVCDKKIQGREYKEHEFWREKYCPSHDHGETPKCCSCERLESFGSKYVQLADERWLCRECMECAVMDTDECVSLHMEMRDFFLENLNMRIEQEFHLYLVEKEALNKAEKEEKIDNLYEIVTRGICLSEEQMIPIITKGPRMGPNKQLITEIVTEPLMVYRTCEVTAILILYGLPRILTGCILAHEMMHAWLRLNGYRNLDMVLEEGLCQVLAHMWLEPQTYSTPDVISIASRADPSAPSSSHIPLPAATISKKGDQSEFEKMLVKFCMDQIETDDSPIYGLGFKKVKKMMDSNNHILKDTINDIVIASKPTQDSKI